MFTMYLKLFFRKYVVNRSCIKILLHRQEGSNLVCHCAEWSEVRFRFPGWPPGPLVEVAIGKAGRVLVLWCSTAVLRTYHAWSDVVLTSASV